MTDLREGQSQGGGIFSLFAAWAATGSAGRTGPATEHRVAAACTEILLLCVGMSLLVVALLADKLWLDSHVLPHMFLSRSEEIALWVIGRAVIALLGLAAITRLRRSAARQVRQGKGKELAIQCALLLLAMLLSIPASEAVLRSIPWSKGEEWHQREEPLRVGDPYLGWRNQPSRTGEEIFGGQRILYHFDAAGHRIAAPGRTVDYRRPSILLAGESIMIGFRLNWSDSIAGRLEAITGAQSANLAVNGYSTDQVYMSLTAELPRFQHPIAVVALFTPTLLERNLRMGKPWLDAALRWHPPRPQWRLQKLITKNILPINRVATIERGVVTTRAVLSGIVEAARARHAEPLIMVPCTMPEQPVERDLRLRILAGLPYVLVPLDPEWQIAGDGHPDTRADLAMARAVATELERHHPGLFARR